MLHFNPLMEILGVATPVTIAARMESRWLCSFNLTTATTTTPAFVNHTFPLSVSVNNKTRTSYSCSCRGRDNDPLSAFSAYDFLGVQPNCSAAEIKAAFRAKVKQFHPDLNRDENETSDAMIRRVIQAYQILSNYTPSQIIETECLDPFDRPECEAFDLFVNELLCVGKACSNPCVERAPHAFTFVPSTGTARAVSQDQGEDYQVQYAVGQCPRSCIYYVTPSQRILLEELLHSIIDAPYDTSAEADLLYSLIIKAKFENNRYQKPKKKTKFSTQHVDWF